MFENAPLLWAGGAAALAAGLTGSLHCALMCGPLACAPLPAAGAGRRRSALSWHGGRLAAYLAVGAGLGLAGAGLARTLAERVQPLLPWLMAAGLAATALELPRRLPAIPGLAGLGRRVAGWGARTSPSGRAFALGAATPLLPCGLLYGLFLAAVGTGSAPGGALVMGLFGVGSLPGLVAAQAGTAWTGRFPRVERVLRRAVPLIAAGVLVWRALMVPAAGAGAPPCH
jgi:uncharacterized protein